MTEPAINNADKKGIYEVIQAYSYTVSGNQDTKLFLFDRLGKRRRVTRKLRRGAIRRPEIMYFVLGVLSIATVSIVHKWSGTSNFINATTYIAAVGLSVGAYQAWLLSLASQAKHINDAFAKFVEKTDLFSTWFDLFYTYNDSIFHEIDTIIKSKDVYASAKIETINKGRDVGCRYWHPALLPRTQEEARIDALLGYFSLLADMYERGNLSISEIGDIAEYYLMAIAKSKAFEAYLIAIKAAFRDEQLDGSIGSDSGYRDKFGSPPFRHLCFLLVELHAYVDLKEGEVYGRFNEFEKIRLRNSP